MEKEQKLEWEKARQIQISEDLVFAAKRQLEFLAMVDRHRFLYDGPVLEHAIRRYKTRWLPLLAKQTESGSPEDSLIPPLDCEWVWHCHRLNPVQYKEDCENIYGRILDSQFVSSLSHGRSNEHTIDIWRRFYPDEPFDLDGKMSYSNMSSKNASDEMDIITYDLVSAVKRQSSFYYQVSRATMYDGRFLQGAVARYKGFLYLIKRNQDMSLKQFCVPTYDIDLIWHSHQLRPVSYGKDLTNLLGRVLEHDDTDSDRRKGKKLDTGFSHTTKQWEDLFGLRYWRAGAMYRGTVPSPLTVTPFYGPHDSDIVAIPDESQNYLSLSRRMLVEVLLEVIAIRNPPSSLKGNFFISFMKNRRDLFFHGSAVLDILSETGVKQVASFQCEPTGALILSVMSSTTNTFLKHAKSIGTVAVNLENLSRPDSSLYIDEWFDLELHLGFADTKPVSLHVAASITVPVHSSYMLQVVKSPAITVNSCFFPLPGKVLPKRSWTRFFDEYGFEAIRMQIRRDSKKTEKNLTLKIQVTGAIRPSWKPFVLAEYSENTWSLTKSSFTLYTEKKHNDDGHILELCGNRHIKLFFGRKLEFEARGLNDGTEREGDFITFVEFCAEFPYGKAIALCGLNSGFIKVNDEHFSLPGTVLVFILSDMFEKEGYLAFVLNKDSEGLLNPEETKSRGSEGGCVVDSSSTLPKESTGGCGSGCSGNELKSGGCGGGCGGKCDNSAKTGGCGGGCGANGGKSKMAASAGVLTQTAD